MSLILFQNFPHSQEERETQADHRSLCSQSFCRQFDFQNGDAEKSEKCHLSQRLGIFIGSDGCLFECPDTSLVKPQIHVERPSVRVQSAPIQSLDQPSHVYASYECHSDISKKKGDNSSSII